MDDSLREQMAAAAIASGIVEIEGAEAETDSTAAEQFATAAPEDGVSPETDDEADDDALAADDGAETEPEQEDLAARLAAIEAEREQERQELARFRAEQARIQNEANEQAWRQAENNLESWYADSLRGVYVAAANDEALIRNSDDPNATRYQLQAMRAQQETWVRDQYRQQRAVYDNHWRQGMQAALGAAYQRSYAEEQLKANHLPPDALQHLMFYPDGSPVDPNHYHLRAAEMREYRKSLATARRRATQAERTAKANELRGTSAAPGSGAATPTGWDALTPREQLAWAAEQMGFPKAR